MPDQPKIDVFGYPGVDDPIPTEIAESLGLKIESTPEGSWERVRETYDFSVNMDLYYKPGWGPFNPNEEAWSRYERRGPGIYANTPTVPGGKKAESYPRAMAIGILAKVGDDLDVQKAKLTEAGFKWSVIRSGTEGPATIVFFKRNLTDSTVTSAIDLVARGLGLWAPTLTAREWWTLRLLQGESRERATAEYTKVTKFLNRLNEKTTMDTVKKDAGISTELEAPANEASMADVDRFMREATSVEKIGQLILEA